MGGEFPFYCPINVVLYIGVSYTDYVSKREKK